MKHREIEGAHKLTAVGLVAGVLVLGGCGLLPKGQANLDVSAKDLGVSSWYGEDFHGKRAANGRPFDMYALTAAHRSLPLGSVARVLNVRNGRSVHVRITDRGPYVQGRMLDLSQAAAEQLGMMRQGVAAVVLEVVGERTWMGQWANREAPATGQLRSDIEVAGHGHGSGDLRRFPRAIRVRQPEDLWREPRQRRVVDVLAADYHVDQRAAGLMVV